MEHKAWGSDWVERDPADRPDLYVFSPYAITRGSKPFFHEAPHTCKNQMWLDQIFNFFKSTMPILGMQWTVSAWGGEETAPGYNP